MSPIAKVALAGAWLVASAGAALGQSGITVSGYASASYSIGENQPASKLNQLRVFDFADRKLKLDLVELVVQRPVSKAGQFGFRIDADAGQSMPRVTAAAGLYRSENGSAGDFDLRQFFVSYVAPIGSGLRIDAGKFVTHIGLDVIDGVDGANGNATRGFLFGYGEPYTHTGLKATYALSGKVSAMVQVSRGWDDVRDNNHAESVGAQLAFTPSERVSLAFNLMVGPERPSNSTDDRVLANVVGTWKASPDWSFGMDALWGAEDNVGGPDVDGRWSGATLTARRILSPAFALTGRVECFADARGDRTGVPQTLTGLTLTPELTLSRHALVRADLRLDHSTRAVFETHSGIVPRQATLLVSAVVHF